MKREVAVMSYCRMLRGISVEYVRVNRANRNALLVASSLTRL